MSLEALFKDRMVRKDIRSTINEAAEIGFGTCEHCGREASLLSVCGNNICERCCDKIIDETYDFDKVFSEPIVESDVMHMISESYVIPDLKKLENDANSKFKGSIPDLLKSYGMNPHKDWDDKLKSGMIYIRDNEISGGKTRVNQFLIDYDCSFKTAQAAQKLAPDKDGTIAPLKVNGKPIVPSNGSQPASHTSISTQSASHTVQKNIQAGPGIKASSDGPKFDVQLTSGITLNCERTNKSVGGKLGIDVTVNKKPNVKVTYYIEDGDNNKAAKNIIEEVKKNPSELLSAFTDEDMKNGYVINKYPAYSFHFDDKSFDGKNISLVMKLGAKVHEKSRIYLSDKSLFNRINLDSEIAKFMDEALHKTYPYLMDGTADVKTSIGKAQTELISIEESSSDKLGELQLQTEIGNVSVKWKSGGSRFKDKEVTKNTVYDVIFGMLKKIIPGFDDSKFKSSFGNYTESFIIDSSDLQAGSSIKAGFDLKNLYDSGEVAFDISLSINNSDLPDKPVKVVYRKSGTKLVDFLKKEAKDKLLKYVSKSDTEGSLTLSAQEKMKTPSKKEAFLYKVASIFMDGLRRGDISGSFDDLECHIDSFNVNKDGKLTSCKIRFYDEDGVLADDADSLFDLIDVAQIVKFLKFEKKEDSSEYGASLIYSVKDLDAFSDSVNLDIMEQAMFEAFSITYVNESGRKQIFV